MIVSSLLFPFKIEFWLDLDVLQEVPPETRSIYNVSCFNAFILIDFTNIVCVLCSDCLYCDQRAVVHPCRICFTLRILVG